VRRRDAEITIGHASCRHRQRALEHAPLGEATAPRCATRVKAMLSLINRDGNSDCQFNCFCRKMSLQSAQARANSAKVTGNGRAHDRER
jgi:hypothetical protein